MTRRHSMNKKSKRPFNQLGLDILGNPQHVSAKNINRHIKCHDPGAMNAIWDADSMITIKRYAVMTHWKNPQFHH